MHVLIIPGFYPTDEYPISGLFFCDQAKALQRNGIQVGIGYVNIRSVRRGVSLRALLQNRFQLTSGLEFDLPTVRMHGWNPYAQSGIGGSILSQLHISAVKRYIEDFGRPDVIHAHCALWAGYAAKMSSSYFRIPYIVTEHSSIFQERTIPKGTEKYLHDAYSGASKVIAVSRALAASMEPYTKELATVIPNLIDTDYFHEPEVLPNPEKFIFLSVARLAQVKGFHILIEAFANQFAGDQSVELRIIGDGLERENLKLLCQNFGVEKQVHFLGTQLKERIREEVWKSHSFVLASTTETFGVVIIEAMATGVPVIATKCGGPEDIIVSDDLGQLVPPNNVSALQTALSRCRMEYSSYNRARSRSYVIKNFSEQAVCSQLIKVYESTRSGN